MKKSWKFRMIAVLLLTVITAAAVSGCDSNTPTPIPDVEGGDYGVEIPDDYSLSLAVISEEGVYEPSAESSLYTYMNDKTGASFGFIEINGKLWESDHELAVERLISDPETAPDGFVGLDFTPAELAALVEAEAIEPIEDMLEQYAPNFMACAAALKATGGEDIIDAITAADGHIYSLPAINWRVGGDAVRFYVNSNLAADYGNGDPPETLREAEELLYAVKAAYPDSSPLLPASSDWSMLVGIAGAFGAFNKGMNDYAVDEAEDGSLRFAFTAEPFRQMLESVAGWYRDGIIPQVVKSDGSGLSQEELMAMYDPNTTAIVMVEGEAPDELLDSGQFVQVWQFEGPNGDKLVTVGNTSVVSNPTAFVPTAYCEQPELAIYCFDKLFSDDAFITTRFGTEGETYNNEYAEYSMIGEVDTVSVLIPVAMTKLPGWASVRGDNEELAEMAGTLAFITTGDVSYQKKIPDITPYLSSDPWPARALTVTASDAAGLLSAGRLADAAGDYAIQVMVGAKDTDADWTAYLGQMEEYGVEEYVQAMEEIVERNLSATAQ